MAAIAAGVVTSTTALVCVVDVQGRMILVNPALLRLLDHQERDVLGRPFWDVLVIPEDLVPARAAHRRAVATATAGPVEADWLDRHGDRHRVDLHSSVIRGADGAVVAIAYVGTDVTDERRSQTELRQRADTDALTGLRNRAALLAALGAALTPGPDAGDGAVGLLFCDLDGFKRVNDEHGHLVGDALLVEVGRRLLGVTRTDQVVSRLGGDEFLILLPEATPSALVRLSAQVKAVVEQPFLTVHGEVRVGVSVGSALGRVGQDPLQLVEQADRHMYGVKTASR